MSTDHVNTINLNAGNGHVNSIFNRPGVSDSYLKAAGCAHIGEDECARAYGFKAAGILIPFRRLDGTPLFDGDKQFARVRLYDATESQKYSQRRHSQVHVFIPPGFVDAQRQSTLVLVEGEFKAASLMEAGITALGLCGITGACQTLDGVPTLNPELVELLEFHRPARLVFLGDSDVVTNAQFATEVTKLRNLILGTKRLSFVENLFAAKPPFGGSKGIDDCRADLGAEFNAWFEALIESSSDVPPKASPAEIFCKLIRREFASVRAAVTGDSHDAHRNLVKLLHSAARLRNETGAMLKIKPLLAELLGKTESNIGTLIKDAGKPVAEDQETTPTTDGVAPSNLEPWEHRVNGDQLLSDIAAFYGTFILLPASAAEVLAVWCLQSWCYELFDFAAIVAVWSPEQACGKGRVLDVTEKVVRSPFRTSNTSAAVLYHVISKGNLTVLVDELDSISDEQRDAICNIMKGGFQSNGKAHRMAERNGEQVVVEFPTYCPKMIATIGLDKLDKATRSRTISIRMQRKPRTQKIAKFRRIDGTILQRKCLRWVMDNADAIKSVPPMEIDECGTDRQEDVWEPLVAIARIAGGEWEKRVRRAAQVLAAGDQDGASETVAHQLLAAFQCYFTERGDKADTKTIIATLNETGDFADVNRGRGLTPHFVAKLLKPYGIEPRVHKMPGGKTMRGYSREDCEQAFATYLSDALAKNPAAKCNSETDPEKIDRIEVFENVTAACGYTSANAVSLNENRGGYGVTEPSDEGGREAAKNSTEEILL